MAAGSGLVLALAAGAGLILAMRQRRQVVDVPPIPTPTPVPPGTPTPTPTPIPSPGPIPTPTPTPEPDPPTPIPEPEFSLSLTGNFGINGSPLTFAPSPAAPTVPGQKFPVGSNVNWVLDDGRRLPGVITAFVPSPVPSQNRYDVSFPPSIFSVLEIDLELR